MKDYAQHDATSLAELVATRQVSAAELLEAAIARADEVEPKLNAIVQRLDALGRSTASGTLTGPFAGVPFLLKDYGQELDGVPNICGSAALKNHIVHGDSAYTARSKTAGLVIFGRTATPEFALKGVTEPEAFGPTRNPINPAHTPGGSSGGAAAVVAAGIVPMAGASDGGGSIRIPAAYCGLFGLRPSRGRVPYGPHHGEGWEGASSEHVLTRSVRDSAAMLDVLAGQAAGDPFTIAPPAVAFAELAKRAPGRLRIGFSTRSPIGTTVDVEVREAVLRAAKQLEAMGHHLEEAEPELDGLALAKSFFTMYLGQVAANMRKCRALGAKENDFELDTRALGLLGEALSAGEYVNERRKWNDYARALGEYFTRFDLYLLPTTAYTAPRIGQLDTPALQRAAIKPILALGLGKALLRSGQVDKMVRDNLTITPFTQLSNLTGTPSMSCPLATSSSGLPIGVQFVAPFGEEGRLLALAVQLEAHFMPGKSAI
ncbi:MAG: amidase family protein [Pseudomonadota bacterium]